jgi:hypothetical protein
LTGGNLLAVFGHSIFQNINHSTIVAWYRVAGFAQNEQRLIHRLNYRLSGVRQSIEQMLGQMFNLFLLMKQPSIFALFTDAQIAYRTVVKLFSSVIVTHA